MQPDLFGARSTFVKSSCTGNFDDRSIFTKNIYFGSTNVRNSYASSTFFKNTYVSNSFFIKNACVKIARTKGTSMAGAYIDSAGIEDVNTRSIFAR